MKIRPDYSSHFPILIKVFEKSKGPVLELGSGIFSTPLLHWLCRDTKRHLTTYEQEEKYFRYIKGFNGTYHEVIKVEDWDSLKLEKPWGMVFVDHQSERRSIDAVRVKDFAEFVVVHDTQKGSNREYHHFENTFPHYKYRYDYKREKPYTSVLSNFNDLKCL